MNKLTKDLMAQNDVDPGVVREAHAASELALAERDDRAIGHMYADVLDILHSKGPGADAEAHAAEREELSKALAGFCRGVKERVQESLRARGFLVDSVEPEEPEHEGGQPHLLLIARDKKGRPDGLTYQARMPFESSELGDLGDDAVFMVSGHMSSALDGMQKKYGKDRVWLQ